MRIHHMTFTLSDLPAVALYVLVYAFNYIATHWQIVLCLVFSVFVTYLFVASLIRMS